MPTCKSCNAKVVRTDAFCGSCGEPVPGAKPVVPLARPPGTSGTHAARERASGSFPPAAQGGTSAQAATVVAISKPEPVAPALTEPHQTGIREREPSEPAPVVPLHRRKNGNASESQPIHEQGDDAPPESRPPESRPAPSPERDTTSLPNMPIPAAPPILASDLLREQMQPTSPGAKVLRWVTVVLCTLCLAGAAWVGGAHPLTFASAALLITLATLALTPMSYASRAASLFVVGLVATGVALWQQTIHGVATEGIILAGATILLSGSLMFRAYYRGARLSRVLVALGFLMLGLWFVISGGHESLVQLEGHWQSWAPAVTQMSFGLLALLSLMAFMDSSTRGGSHVWAVALLVVYAAHVGLMVANEVWPLAEREGSLDGPSVAALLAGTVGTIIAGLALAQLFVLVHRRSRNRRKSEN